MIPPTPTPYVPDPGVQIIEIPDMSLWDSAPSAVGFWNRVPEATTLFQALLIIGIATAFVYIFIGIANQVASDSDD